MWLRFQHTYLVVAAARLLLVISTMDQLQAVDEQLPVSNELANTDSAGSRRQLKAQLKVQRKLVEEFQKAVGGIQKQQEVRMQRGGSAGEMAKERRKSCIKLIKAVSDPAMSLEERMRVLQSSVVDVLQDQLQQDAQFTDLQSQLEKRQKEVEAGKAELTQSQQKVDNLQSLSRALSRENKTLSEESRRQRQQTEKVQGLLSAIQQRIDGQQQETHKVLEHNNILQQENALLKAQLGSTQELLDQLRTTQEDKISALADKLKEQNDAMTQAAKLHEVMNTVMKENEALTLKAALASTYKERNDVLEKAFTEAQAQAVHHREQMSEMQASLKKATKVLQSFDKLQKTMTEQQQVTSQLMQERQLLQQQVQLLQQQSKEQADKLRRTQLQKQRLEGLCRTLQGRSGAAGTADSLPAGDASPEDAAVAAGGDTDSDSQTTTPDSKAAPGTADSQAAQSDHAQPAADVVQAAAAVAEVNAAGTLASSTTAADAGDVRSAEEDAAGTCHDVVQEVLDKILQQ